MKAAIAAVVTAVLLLLAVAAPIEAQRLPKPTGSERSLYFALITTVAPTWWQCLALLGDSLNWMPSCVFGALKPRCCMPQSAHAGPRVAFQTPSNR